MSAPASEGEPLGAAGASDTVFGGILAALEAHRMVPGQRLVEVDLATAFGVSRNSVREAFQRLAAEGVVELVRNKGAVIRLLSVRQTLDVLEVAERISGLLARTAARAIGQGAPGQPLKEAVRLLVQANASADPAAFGRARRHYYRVMLELSGNHELRRLVPIMQMPIVYAQYRLPTLQAMRLHDYQAIVKAVLAADENGAELAAMAHVANVRGAILAGAMPDEAGEGGFLAGRRSSH